VLRKRLNLISDMWTNRTRQILRMFTACTLRWWWGLYSNLRNQAGEISGGPGYFTWTESGGHAADTELRQKYLQRQRSDQGGAGHVHRRLHHGGDCCLEVPVATGGQLCWISHSDDKYFDWDHIYRVSRNQAGSSIVLVNNNKSEYTQILSNHDMLNHGFGSLIGSFSSFTMCLLCTFVLILVLL